MKILVIDAQGGGLGRQIVTRIKEAHPEYSVTAVGTNTEATNAMRKAGADIAATGENAVIVACRTAQVIVGPFGIATADAMMGEISPAMANAVSSSAAYRILIPMNLCDTYVAGVMPGSAAILEDAMQHLRQITGGEKVQ